MGNMRSTSGQAGEPLRLAVGGWRLAVGALRTNGIRLRQAYGATGSMGLMGLMGYR